MSAIFIIGFVVIAFSLIRKKTGGGQFSLDMPGELAKHRSQIKYAGETTYKEILGRGYIKPGEESKFEKHLLNFKGINSEWTDPLLTDAGLEPPDGYSVADIWSRHYKRYGNYQQLKDWKKTGFKKVKVQPQSGNRKTCKHATKHSGIYRIENAPLLPCKNCDSENCLCWYSIVE